MDGARHDSLSPGVFDAVDLLDELGPHGLADVIVEAAERLVGAPVALYVIDLAGANLARVRGSEPFPQRIPIQQAVGPELPARHAAEVVQALAPQGYHAVPIWLRARATAVLLTEADFEGDLTELGRQAAAAMDMASRYTDVFEAARRPVATTPAAELQETLLPPRLTRVPGGELAASLLPAYDMGGDWFDYADAGGELWLAVGDARGKGAQAAALSALAVGGFRAVRRFGGDLLEAAAAIDQVIEDLGDPTAYVTAVLAGWTPDTRTFQWLNCGHPTPLIVSVDGREREYEDRPRPPLGLGPLGGPGQINSQVLEPGDRVLLYTDGVSERRTNDGRLGREGLTAAIKYADSDSAGSLATSLLETVRGASTEDLEDDATILVLKVN